MLQSLKRVLWLCFIAGLILSIDQIAKHLVVNTLQLGQSWEPIPQISGFIRVTRSYNTGAAFGMFPFASDLFLIVALITIGVFVFVIYPRLPNTAWLSRLGIAMITGGALSNALDRLTFGGKVVDYIHVQLSPTFSNISNFGDHAVTLGVIILLIDAWFIERREQAKQLAQQQEAVSPDEAHDMDVDTVQQNGDAELPQQPETRIGKAAPGIGPDGAKRESSPSDQGVSLSVNPPIGLEDSSQTQSP
jgi:signal peptidase II